MADIWKLTEAGKKSNQVVDEASHHGPQIIARHGVEVAVVLSSEEYRCWTASREKMADFFRRSPLAGSDLDLVRKN